MKKITQILLLISSPAIGFGSITFNGTALNNVPGLNVGDVGVYLVDTDGSAFSVEDLTLLTAGLSITDSATYPGFHVIGSATAGSVFTSTTLGSGFTFDLGIVSNGDSFGILVFSNSTATTLISDSFNLYTNASWLIPSDPASRQFGSTYPNLGSSDSITASGSVVPEPSTYAALAGLFVLSFAMVRRRRI
jgi:hypothetical protein